MDNWKRRIPPLPTLLLMVAGSLWLTSCTTEPDLHSFGIAPSEFRTRFNVYSNYQTQDPGLFELGSMTWQTPTVFWGRLTPYLTVMGTVDSLTENVKDITVMFRPSDTSSLSDASSMQMGAELVLTIHAVIHAANGLDFPDDQRLSILRELGLFHNDMNAYRNQPSKHLTVENRKYWFSYYDTTGLWFGIETVPPVQTAHPQVSVID